MAIFKHERAKLVKGERTGKVGNSDVYEQVHENSVSLVRLEWRVGEYYTGTEKIFVNNKLTETLVDEEVYPTGKRIGTSSEVDFDHITEYIPK